MLVTVRGADKGPESCIICLIGLDQITEFTDQLK